MKSKLASFAISAILVSGLVFLPGVNMNAYSQSQQAKQSSSKPIVNLLYVAVEKHLTLPDGTKFNA